MIFMNFFINLFEGETFMNESELRHRMYSNFCFFVKKSGTFSLAAIFGGVTYSSLNLMEAYRRTDTLKVISYLASAMACATEDESLSNTLMLSSYMIDALSEINNIREEELNTLSLTSLFLDVVNSIGVKTGKSNNIQSAFYLSMINGGAYLASQAESMVARIRRR